MTSVWWILNVQESVESWPSVVSSRFWLHGVPSHFRPPSPGWINLYISTSVSKSILHHNVSVALAINWKDSASFLQDFCGTRVTQPDLILNHFLLIEVLEAIKPFFSRQERDRGEEEERERGKRRRNEKERGGVFPCISSKPGLQVCANCVTLCGTNTLIYSIYII